MSEITNYFIDIDLIQGGVVIRLGYAGIITLIFGGLMLAKVLFRRVRS